MSKNSKLVYSTEHGRIKSNGSDSTQNAYAGSDDGIVRLKRESKGRGGKGVTLVSGVPGTAQELKALAKKLKQLCGTGGTVKDGIIEIQGEQRETLKPYLEKQGFQVKIAGG